MRMLISPLVIVLAIGFVGNVSPAGEKESGTKTVDEAKAPAAEENPETQVEKTADKKVEKAAETGIQWQSSLKESWARSSKEKRPLLLYFTTKNCYYCTKMLNETLKDKGVISKISQGYISVSVDGTLSPRLVQQLRIRAYPTTVIITPDAKMSARLVGYIDVAELEAELKKATTKTAAATNDTTTR